MFTVEAMSNAELVRLMGYMRACKASRRLVGDKDLRAAFDSIDYQNLSYVYAAISWFGGMFGLPSSAELSRAEYPFRAVLIKAQDGIYAEYRKKYNEMRYREVLSDSLAEDIEDLRKQREINLQAAQAEYTASFKSLFTFGHVTLDYDELEALGRENV